MTPTQLLESICQIWEIPSERIPGKQPQFCAPRYAYFWKMKELYPDMYLREIGDLNVRTFYPSAVCQAFKRHHELLSTDVDYRDKYNQLEQRISQKAA